MTYQAMRDALIRVLRDAYDTGYADGEFGDPARGQLIGSSYVTDIEHIFDAYQPGGDPESEQVLNSPPKQPPDAI